MRSFPVLAAGELERADVPVAEAMAAHERNAAQQPHPCALVPEPGGFFQPIAAHSRKRMSPA
jgi:hypothetical protein